MKTSIFETLSKKYDTPLKVQKFIKSFEYNKELDGETCNSALTTLKLRKAHCLEGSVLAAAILEHHGYPPLLMSLESKDLLDHVLFVFQSQGKWGAVSQSREKGLCGREPIFKTLKGLAESYFDPYVDDTGRITAYGLANLNEVQIPWRDSSRNIWSLEFYLNELKHETLKMPEQRYKKLYESFMENRMGALPKDFWW